MKAAPNWNSFFSYDKKQQFFRKEPKINRKSSVVQSTILNHSCNKRNEILEQRSV